MWKFLVDLSNLKKTTPGVPTLSSVSPGSMGVGSTFSGKDRGMTLVLRVTEYAPYERLGLEFTAPGFMKGTTDHFHLETMDNKTKLTESWDTKLHGFFRLLGPFFAPRTKRDVTTRLSNMKDSWIAT